MTLFKHHEILAKVGGLDERLARIEARLDALVQEKAAREDALRGELALKQQELDALGQQSLHVLDRLDEARRRIRELEQGRPA